MTKFSEGDRVTAFKGFNADMTCRGFQYEEGKTYEQDTPAKLCVSGFHAVTSPLDVFAYYPPAESVYRLVELGDVSEERESDSKVAGRTITIGAEIGIPGLVKAHVEVVRAGIKPDGKKSAHKTDDRSVASNTGNYSVASNTGDRSAASNTGDRSVASNTGDRSVASNTGNCSAASNTGDYSVASNTGDCSVASNTGYHSAASNTGDYSVASNTGYRSAASNTGNCSAASNTGNRSVASNTGDRSAALVTGSYSKATASGADALAIATGYKGEASGTVGAWLVLTERDEEYKIVAVETVKVDGKRIKADVFYTLRGGKVVAA